MALLPGTHVGHYEVLSAIGAGGMGEVYRARDLQLGRHVALKILPEHVATEPDRVTRFQREAQLLASLNHPHIAAIYGLAEFNASRALVLELVDGPTLDERLQQGPLDVIDAIHIARQIVEALEAAHGSDVVHRDLKPANIKVTLDGRVKVLDFGLAKLVNRVESGSSPSMSPTLSVQATLAGVILGTAAYMSPEQARGKVVDRRTDVWAFGCVLFEMITGRRAFDTGESISDAVAAILRSEPNWSALPHTTPESLRRLLRRCLTKDPRERLHDIADARLELRDALAEEPLPPAVEVSPTRRHLAWVVAAILTLVVLAVTLIRWPTRSADEQPAYKSALLLPDRSGFRNFGGRLALSPDGRKLAFVAETAGGRRVLYMRRLDVGDERELADTQDASHPFWSPDSQNVAFIVDGTLKRVNAAGGPALTITPGAGASSGSWSPDDVILYAHETDGRIHRVAASGGASSPVTSPHPARKFDRHDTPFFLPDGRRFLYRSVGSEAHVASLDSPEQTQVLERATTTFFANGFLVFLRGATLMAQPFDPVSLATTGEATPLVEQVQIGPPPGFTGAFSVSATGVLVYEAGVSPTSRLLWLDRSGKELGVLGDEGHYGYVQLSPDGRRVAVSVRDSSTSRNRDIWLYDVVRNVGSRFTTDRGDEFSPVWSPDGSRLVYASTADAAGLDLYVKGILGDVREQPLRRTPGVNVSEIPASWSSDGRFMLYRTPPPNSDLWILPLAEDATPKPFANTRFRELDGEFSPDGQWVAYTSDETGRSEVYLAPIATPGAKVLVSSAGGELARWRRDGQELFYITPDDRLMAVTVRKGSSDVGEPRAMFSTSLVRGTSFPYAISGDGQRFLVNAPGKHAAPLPVTLLVNWPATISK